MKKFYCVWSEQDTILCLTTDYGIALDRYAQHMEECERFTDDQWSDTTAFIEDFDEYPTERADIFDYISPQEAAKWMNGEPVFL